MVAKMTANFSGINLSNDCYYYGLRISNFSFARPKVNLLKLFLPTKNPLEIHISGDEVHIVTIETKTVIVTEEEGVMTIVTEVRFLLNSII